LQWVKGELSVKATKRAFEAEKWSGGRRARNKNAVLHGIDYNNKIFSSRSQRAK